MLPLDTEVYTFRWDDMSYQITGFVSEGWQSILDESNGWYESDLLQAILERYGTGGHYVDFGAFIGTHSIFFDKVCKADCVTAIEPHAPTFRLLYNNLIANGCENVDALLCAVGVDKGRSILELSGKNWGCVSALPGDQMHGSVPILRSCDVITTPPKLIKIDCEDASFDVLNGCLPVIEAYRPVVVMELPSEAHYDQAAQVLVPMGYVVVGGYCHTPTFILEYAK